MANTPSRRRLLQVGLAGGALLAVGGASLALWPGTTTTPPGPLKVLDAKSYGVLAVFADTVLPGSNTAPSATELDVASRVDDTLSRLHPADAAELKQVLGLLENALTGIILAGRPVPFTKASGAQRAATLSAWQTSRLPLLRTAYKALRNLCAAAYYSHPGAYASTGYGGPPDFGQASAPALQVPQNTVPEKVEAPTDAPPSQEVPG